MAANEADALHAHLDDGLDEAEAVAVALALSPAYRAELSRIDAARADLTEARSPANPQLTLAGALGPISAVATLLAPLESLWQMPRRSAVAAYTLELTADGLVQSGLNLARDARLAHAQRGLAEQRLRARAELARVWAELARFAEVGVRAGQSSPAEADGLRAEAAIARDAYQVAESELFIARAQLRAVLGLEAHAPLFALSFTRVPAAPPVLTELARVARVSRPDVRVSELALEAAAARVGFERSRVLAIAAQLEGHWTKPDALAARVGARIDLPIFNLNQGGIGRANAELARATALVVETRQRVMLEVAQARTRAAQAFATLETYRCDVIPALSAALTAAHRNYELGEESYLVVLDVLRRIGDARLREAELLAEWRRGDAELERAVGARVGGSPP